MTRTRTLTNCKLCICGRFVEDDIHLDAETGRFIDSCDGSQSEVVDLDGETIAPGYLELQSNVSALNQSVRP